MGCCLSCRCTPPNTFNTISLVHLNGYVQDFDHPISVSEIIGKPPKQFLCTAAQLVSAGSKPVSLNPTPTRPYLLSAAIVNLTGFHFSSGHGLCSKEAYSKS